MFDIKIDGELNKALQIPKQLVFATAKTLTRVAGMSQDAADDALQQEFHIRRPWWKHGARYGIKIKKATKTDLESAVYTNADWLLEAEGLAGGVKKPDKHAGHLAVPDVEETRHGIGNVVRRAEKAKYLLANPDKTRAFKVQSKSGYTLILQRKGGKGGRGGKKSRIVLKYIFVNSVRVPHQSAIVAPTHRTVLTHAPTVFNQELRNAFATAKGNTP